MTSTRFRHGHLVRHVVCGLAAWALLFGPLEAQQLPVGAEAVSDWTADDVPAHLAVVDGRVVLERDGQALPADVNAPLLEGDRLRTEDGRVDILFADGSALDLDVNTTVDLLSDALLRLRGGAVRLLIARLANDVNYRIDAAGSTVRVESAGDYLVTVSDTRRTSPEVDLSVYRGTATLENNFGRTMVRAGASAWASADAAPSAPRAFNASASDEFDGWVESQREAQISHASSQYLPADVRPYGGALDEAGTWAYEPAYGAVWYPQVGPGWQPYSDGYFAFVGTFGWFWIGSTRWSWPTHHYGSWGVSSGRWFWMPDHRWAPARVAWSTTPDSVSWCPLGRDGRAVGSAFTGPALSGRPPGLDHRVRTPGSQRLVRARRHGADAPGRRDATLDTVAEPAEWPGPGWSGDARAGVRIPARPDRDPLAGSGAADRRLAAGERRLTGRTTAFLGAR